MASPTASPSHPLTPPADPSPPSAQNAATQLSSQTTTTATTSAVPLDALLAQPLTSASDNGSAKRPRDHRLIHLLLASHGVAAYQERVPLQLMDFAYRYTSSVLGDALHVQHEGYDNAAEPQQGGRGRGRGGGGSKTGLGGAEEGDVSLTALRMAIASRMSYQFQGSLPKEFLKGLAEERNRIGLGAGVRQSEKEGGAVIGGVRLPPEKYCLTGVGWGLKEEWESEGEEDVEVDGGVEGDMDMTQADGLVDADAAEEEDGDEEGEGKMEDVFGQDAPEGDGDGGGGGQDEEMGES